MKAFMMLNTYAPMVGVSLYHRFVIMITTAETGQMNITVKTSSNVLTLTASYRTIKRVMVSITAKINVMSVVRFVKQLPMVGL